MVKKQPAAAYWLYAMRPKQWIKNLFVLLPLIFGQKLFVFPENLHGLMAFLIFCLASSGVYLINDRFGRLRPGKSIGVLWVR